ncbi:hypothetical protein Q31a_42250 [Aureliella helgolandensis]|uniref:Leucine Rich repeats (2 copies) n=1 Tax=Aureliella helgolandensis TaxID=2527968 RepID=A0A518GBH8_9BACT|nr:hypothetical protein Q31a_42250 [Aureliella helgolandensis]
MLLAGALGGFLLWKLLSLFPQASAWIFIAALLAVAVTLFSWRLFRSRRIELRTLVLIVPVCVAVICFPSTYVVEKWRITANLDRPGVSNYSLAPNGWLAESFGACFELLFDHRVSSFFQSGLRLLHLDLNELQEDTLTGIPIDHLMYVRVSASKKQMLTKNVIAWLNEIPEDCVIDLVLFGLVDEDAGLLDNLEHDVHGMYVCDQVLSEKSLSSILNVAPNELWFSGIGFVRNNSFVEAPAINVDVLRISKNNFSGSDIAGLLNATNPKTLVLAQDLAPVTPEVFRLIFSLERLEGLSTQVPWLTTQHLESLSLSETLRWASIEHSGIPEEKFEELRTASQTVRINGKSGRPD